MPITDWGWEVTEAELRSWIIQDDNDIILINKPALVVCHPSKRGPWSSLVGACRECLGYERTHLIARLDRETSGIILLAKHRLAARHFQMALERRAVTKSYLAILEGSLTQTIEVDAAIGKDPDSIIHCKSAVRTDGKNRQPKRDSNPFILHRTTRSPKLSPLPVENTKFEFTQHIGHSIIGDKLYGPDETFSSISSNRVGPKTR